MPLRASPDNVSNNCSILVTSSPVACSPNQNVAAETVDPISVVTSRTVLISALKEPLVYVSTMMLTDSLSLSDVASRCYEAYRRCLV